MDKLEFSDGIAESQMAGAFLHLRVVNADPPDVPHGCVNVHMSRDEIREFAGWLQAQADDDTMWVEP